MHTFPEVFSMMDSR